MKQERWVAIRVRIFTLFLIAGVIGSKGWANECKNSLVDDQALRSLNQSFWVPQPTQSLFRIATNRSVGMSWIKALNLNLKFHPHFPDAESAQSYFSKPEISYAATVDSSDFIPVTYSVFPAIFKSRELTSELGIPNEAFIFNMSLADPLPGFWYEKGFSDKEPSHVQDSVGYIRFYVKGSDIIVVEIQNDIYRHIKDTHLKAQFKLWGRQLLVAFENYVDRVYWSSLSNKEGRILIAGSDYQKRRWQTTMGSGISDDLVRLIYRDLPQKLGYKKDRIDYGFEWLGHLSDTDPGEILAIENGYVLRQSAWDQLKETGYRFLYRQQEQFSTQNPWLRHYAEVLKWQEFHSRPKEEALESASGHPRRSLDIQVNPNSVIVPYRKFPKDILYKSESLRVYHEQRLGAIASDSARWNHLTLLGRGTADANSVLEDSFEFEGQNYRFLGWVGVDRHPTLSRIESEAVGKELYHTVWNFKGAGRRSLEEKSHLSPEIFAFQPSETLSHQIWGGLLESHGLQEFRNTLGLQELASRVSYPISIAFTVDVGLFLSVPRWDGSKLTSESLDQFLKTKLPETPERIVQFRSLTKSALRILAIPQLIKADQVQSSDAFLLLLKDAYKAFGQTLLEISEKRTEAPLKLTSEGESEGRVPLWTESEKLRFLRRVYLRNKTAADFILREFDRRFLGTVGFVHGLKGHLGGTYTMILQTKDDDVIINEFGLGAPSGGSTQYRNVTLGGEIRDLDENIYLPQDPSPNWAAHLDLADANLDWFQRQDLRHWQESRYWMRLLLQGRDEVPAQLEMPHFLFGDPTHEEMLISIIRSRIGAGVDENADFIKREMKENSVFNHRGPINTNVFTDPELFEIYKQGLDAGASSIMAPK